MRMPLKCDVYQSYRVIFQAEELEKVSLDDVPNPPEDVQGEDEIPPPPLDAFAEDESNAVKDESVNEPVRAETEESAELIPTPPQEALDSLDGKEQKMVEDDDGLFSTMRQVFSHPSNMMKLRSKQVC